MNGGPPLDRQSEARERILMGIPDDGRVAAFELAVREQCYLDFVGERVEWERVISEAASQVFDAESSRDAAWEVVEDWKQMVKLSDEHSTDVMQRAVNMKHIIEAYQLIVEAVAESDDDDLISELKVDYISTPGYPRTGLRNAAKIALLRAAGKDTIPIITVAPVTTETYARCVHWQCAHLAIDHGTDQEVDLDGRPTSPEFLVCFACLKVSDDAGVYSHDFEPPGEVHLV